MADFLETVALSDHYWIYIASLYVGCAAFFVFFYGRDLYDAATDLIFKRKQD